ncbi:hypothetical protein SprV_0401462100 [Sparganum proliferum]
MDRSVFDSSSSSPSSSFSSSSSSSSSSPLLFYSKIQFPPTLRTFHLGKLSTSDRIQTLQRQRSFSSENLDALSFLGGRVKRRITPNGSEKQLTPAGGERIKSS